MLIDKELIMETKEKCCTVSDKPEEESGNAAPMMEMMKKMMAQMGQGDPMAMMKKMMAEMGKGESGMPMEKMMGMCMGMCGEMLSSMKETISLAAFATPELRNLFTGWLATLEGQAVELIKKNGAMDAKA